MSQKLDTTITAIVNEFQQYYPMNTKDTVIFIDQLTEFLSNFVNNSER